MNECLSLYTHANQAVCAPSHIFWDDVRAITRGGDRLPGKAIAYRSHSPSRRPSLTGRRAERKRAPLRIDGPALRLARQIGGGSGQCAIAVVYIDVRWRRTSRYSCEINAITKTSKTVNTMRPYPCVYEKR